MAAVIFDLNDVKRGAMAGVGCLAMQRPVLEHALQLFRRSDHGVAEGRREFLYFLAVEPMYGEIDPEALFGAIDEFLAEAGADIRRGHSLSVPQDRRDAENPQRFPPGFDTDNRFAGLDRLKHGFSPSRDVIAEDL